MPRGNDERFYRDLALRTADRPVGCREFLARLYRFRLPEGRADRICAIHNMMEQARPSPGFLSDMSWGTRPGH
jgi:hypothetical protein